MSMSPKSLFRYFKDCYQADHESLSVRSIFSSNFKLKHLLKGSERIIEQHEVYAPLDHPKVEAILNELELNSLELDFCYTAIYILGKDQTGFGRQSNIASPLIFIPLKINRGEEVTVELQFSELRLNLELLRKFDLADGLSHDAFIEGAEQIIQSAGGLYGIKGLLDKYYPQLDSEALVEWPKLWSGARMQRQLSQTTETGQFSLVPAAAYLLVPKNQHTLSVLNDLEVMAEQDQFSAPLAALFEGKSISPKGTQSWWRHNLNKEQYQGLQNAFQYQNSIIVGPPGTGKSYTIANIAAEAISRQEKVLIASRNKPAVEVIRNILEKEYQLKDYLVQTSGHSYLRSLKARIARFLSGIQSRHAIKISDHELESLDLRIAAAEKRYNRQLDIELKRLKNNKVSKFGLSELLQHFWLHNAWRDYEAFFDYFLEILELRMLIQKRVQEYSQQKIRYYRHLHRNSHRSTISQYQDALNSSNFTELKTVLEQLEYEKLLDIFPIWLVHLQELNSLVPQKKELFDLLIIDEASQVDIAQALPAIQRAKRVVIVGDPMQLSHYSFLSRSKQKQFQIKHGFKDSSYLNYRDQSILDLYLQKLPSQDQVSFLREHFRSSPLLIGFSNEAFYQGQLEVLKSTPDHLQSSQIEIHALAGERNQDGVNVTEAEAIYRRLKGILKQQKAQVLKESIGILSPFSAQVRFLKSYLSERLDNQELRKHDLLIGGPYHFQGTERDIMLLSFAVDSKSHQAAFRHLNKAEVFNVSISRARSKVFVFHSLGDKRKKADGLLGKYLQFLESQKEEAYESDVKDAFATEVRKSLKRYQGYEVSYEAVPVAGMVLDVLVRYKEQYFFIDLIGFPGDFEGAFHFDRYQSLARIGIHSLPLHYSYWVKDPSAARQKLIQAIKKIYRKA
jgi:hypothetical protein